MPQVKSSVPPRVKVPIWVPDAVRKWALSEEGKDESEVQQRLLTDERMRRVWRELTRHKRDNYRTTDRLFHQATWLPGEFSDCPFDLILVAFFFWSRAAAKPLPMATRNEIAKLSDLESKTFPSFSGPSLSARRSAIVVKRHTARDHLRSYVLVLGQACRALFNSPLYSTVATTASVALNAEVKSGFVRQVLRSRSL